MRIKKLISTFVIFTLLLSAMSITTFATSYIVGDVNSDNRINVQDVTEIQKYLTNMVDINSAIADFNCDSKVNITDCTLMQKYISGEIGMYNGFLYSFKSGKGTIIGYNGSSTSLKIPSQIQSYKITAIGDSAFSNNKKITSVAMPDSIVSVGYYAFLNCTSLTKVTIKNAQCHIDSSSFEGCTSLTYFVQG